jgi:DNA-binding Lrp family transcriptional regulator
MDEIDRKLLNLLRDDSSRPLKTLAAAVGLSRSSVRDRIARLQAGGTIRRYTIETAPDNETLTAVLQVRLARTPDPQVVQAVIAREDVFRCRSLSGPVDLLVEIVGTDLAAINRSRDAIAGIRGVVDVETSFVLKLDKSSSFCGD